VVLLYDNATGELVSYNLSEFGTTDVAPLPMWVDDTIIITAIAVLIVMVSVRAVQRHRDRKKAEAGKAELEKETERRKDGEKEDARTKPKPSRETYMSNHRTFRKLPYLSLILEE
jgi:hypothetical protein